MDLPNGSPPDGLRRVWEENCRKWWTRSQSIRTEGEVPFEVALLEAEGQPVYQRIAEEAEHLRRLGLSDSKIAWHLGVDDKTVAKAIRWRSYQR